MSDAPLMTYDPFDWYWLADDGRLYASARQLTVEVGDVGYLAWCEAGRVATAWPRDEESEQTDAALEEVIAPYGLYLSRERELIAYLAACRWRAETGGLTVGGVIVATDDRSKMLIMGARMQAEADPAFTTRWKGGCGAFVTLAAPQIIAVSDALLAHVASCFAIEAELLGAIEDGTVTTREEIDAVDWPRASEE